MPLSKRISEHLGKYKMLAIGTTDTSVGASLIMAIITTLTFAVVILIFYLTTGFLSKLEQKCKRCNGCIDPPIIASVYICTQRDYMLLNGTVESDITRRIWGLSY